MERLPYIDEHAMTIGVARDRVWDALERVTSASLADAERNPVTKILGTQPRAGFAVAESVEHERLALAGRHRFARYSLTFELDDVGGGITRLRALTHAAFPGVRGQIYKTLVIRSRGHVLATRLILRRVARSAAHAR
jgi:hypothetical protein